MKTKDVAKLLNVSDSTIRLYARRFHDFLGPESKPGRRTRYYSDRDVQVLRYISEQKDAGATDDDVTASLRSMDDSELPPVPSGAAQLNDEQRRHRLALEVVQLREKVANLEDQLAAQESELEKERNKHRQALQGEQARRESVEKELTTVKSELMQKSARLEVLQEERRPLEFWLKLIAVVVVFVALIAVLVVWYVGQGGV